MTYNNEKIVLLTIKQASEMIDGLSEYRIRQLCIQKKIKCIKAGNKYLINKNTLISYLS